MKTAYETLCQLRTQCQRFLAGIVPVSSLGPRALSQAFVELMNDFETMRSSKTAPPPPPVIAPLPDAVDAAYRFFCGLNNHVKDMSPQLSREYRQHIAALGQVIKGTGWDEREIRRQKEYAAAWDEAAQKAAELRKSAKDRLHEATSKAERQADKVARFADDMLKDGIGVRHPTLKEQAADETLSAEQLLGLAKEYNKP